MSDFRSSPRLPFTSLKKPASRSRGWSFSSYVSASCGDGPPSVGKSWQLLDYRARYQRPLAIFSPRKPTILKQFLDREGMNPEHFWLRLSWTHIVFQAWCPVALARRPATY